MPASLGSALYTIGISFFGIQQLLKIPGLIDDVTKAYLASQQAAFALEQTFGKQAAAYEASAQRLADAIKVTNREAQQQVTIFGTLANNYHFSAQQIEILSKRSADLSATSGKDLVDAAQRVQSAMRGEGEAAEQLGLTLNSDAVKATGAMTDAQRANFESLDQVSKAQIIYREFLRQSAFAEGAAEKAAGKAAASYREFDKASENLSITLGRILSPALAKSASGMAAMITGVDDATKSVEALSSGQVGFVNATGEMGEAAERLGKAFGIRGVEQFGDNLQTANVLLDQGTTSANKLADALGIPQPFIDDAQEAAQRIAELNGAINSSVGLLETYDTRKAQKELGDLGKEGQALAQMFLNLGESDAVTRFAESAKLAAAALTAEMKKAFDQGQLLADQLEAMGGNLDDRRSNWGPAAQAALGDNAGVTGPTLAEQIEAATQAIEDGVDAATEARSNALREQREENKIATAQAIKDAERQRDGEIAAIEATRDAALAALETERDARNRARELEDRARAQSERMADRQRDERLQADLAALETRQNQQLAALDAEQAAVEGAHEQAMAALDRRMEREENRHTRAMDNLKREEEAQRGPLEARLKVLDAEEQARSRADTDRNLSSQLREAKRDLAQAKLDPRNQETGAAREKLADAERAIADEAHDRTVEDERSEIEVKLDNISTEFAARKDAEDKRAAAAKARFDAEKTAIDQATQADLTAIAERRDAATTAYQARAAEMHVTYDAETQRIEDLRILQAQTLKDNRAEEDTAFKARQVQAKETYDAELAAIHALYDGDDGSITKIKELSAATDTELGNQERRWGEWSENIRKEIAARTGDLRAMLDLQNQIGTGTGAGASPAGSYKQSKIGGGGPGSPAWNTAFLEGQKRGLSYQEAKTYADQQTGGVGVGPLATAPGTVPTGGAPRSSVRPSRGIGQQPIGDAWNQVGPLRNRSEFDQAFEAAVARGGLVGQDITNRGWAQPPPPMAPRPSDNGSRFPGAFAPPGADSGARGGPTVQGPLIGVLNVRNDRDREIVIQAVAKMLDVLDAGTSQAMSSQVGG